ncbi:hypothetical protein N7508_005852 [Penicillium antarcticum]|uniref:uncharacterized protein n=1 Tax=Penicillium antarcticum TaxID=416450 RepID=UPI00239E456C|nr:uncharacterized protein N7508_005852 [Penicillium antarcticum]KAJ5306837.1 hypothetical protein N7508_005852 [Penicillium antarcticum]
MRRHNSPITKAHHNQSTNLTLLYNISNNIQTLPNRPIKIPTKITTQSPENNILPLLAQSITANIHKIIDENNRLNNALILTLLNNHPRPKRSSHNPMESGNINMPMDTKPSHATSVHSIVKSTPAMVAIIPQNPTLNNISSQVIKLPVSNPTGQIADL